MPDYGHRNSYKEELYQLFPLPSTTIVTRGSQIGIILKFKTFYLKIYDATYEDAYVIQGYLYNKNVPVFEEKVDTYKLGEFAKQFNREDYLTRYHKLCDDFK